MNPYASTEQTPKSTASLFASRDLFGEYKMLPKKGINGGRRGALLKHFCEKLNPTRIASGYPELNEKAIIRLLPFMNDIRSLDWLNSVCTDASHRGYSYAKRFWYIQKLQKSVGDIIEKGLV
jgi:hypothetical protein